MSGFTSKRITANCGIVYLHVDKERGSELGTSGLGESCAVIRFRPALSLTPERRLRAARPAHGGSVSWRASARPLTLAAESAERPSQTREAPASSGGRPCAGTSGSSGVSEPRDSFEQRAGIAASEERVAEVVRFRPRFRGPAEGEPLLLRILKDEASAPLLLARLQLPA